MRRLLRRVVPVGRSCARERTGNTVVHGLAYNPPRLGQTGSRSMATNADVASIPYAPAPLGTECADAQRTRAGLAFGLGAYLAWGFIPAYFKLLAHVPPLTVLAHRVVWSVAFLSLLLTLQSKWGEVRDA